MARQKHQNQSRIQTRSGQKAKLEMAEETDSKIAKQTHWQMAEQMHLNRPRIQTKNIWADKLEIAEQTHWKWPNRLRRAKQASHGLKLRLREAWDSGPAFGNKTKDFTYRSNEERGIDRNMEWSKIGFKRIGQGEWFGTILENVSMATLGKL